MKVPNYLNLTQEAQEELDGAPNGVVSFSSIVSASYRLKKQLKGEVRDGKFHVQVDAETLRALIAEHRRFSPVSAEEASEEIERSEHRLNACREANPFLDLSKPTLLIDESMNILTEFYRQNRTQFLPALEKACGAANLAEKEAVDSLADIATAIALKGKAPASVDPAKVRVEISQALTRKGPRAVAELSRICAKLREAGKRKGPEAPMKTEPTVVVEGKRTTISIGPSR